MTDLIVLQQEFEDVDTAHERRVEILTTLREQAALFYDEQNNTSMQCVMCKRSVFVALWNEALIEGHIYSHDGQREFSITRTCEYCFDKITKEPNDG